MKVIISPFCTKNSSSACKVPLNDIIPEIIEKLPFATPGFRDGVILVKVDPINFTGQLRTLKKGDKFECQFIPRIEGEESRKKIRVIGPADDIQEVEVVLYSKQTLEEGGESSDPSADYEVVTILAKIKTEPQPMPPDTLMANHFLDSGGTATNMSDNEFVKSLKLSYFFWKDKAITVK